MLSSALVTARALRLLQSRAQPPPPVSLIAHLSVPVVALVYRSPSKHWFHQLLHVLGAGVMCVLSVLFISLHTCLFFFNHEIVSSENEWNMPSSIYQDVGCVVDV